MKVTIIGLDGMTWRILKPLLDQGVMPNVKRYFITGGSFGFLESVVPPLTSPAWTSIFTGVNPGKHGAFNFFKVKYDYSTKILSSYDVKYPRIHQMLTQLGYRSIVINVPHSVPFVMLNGYGISDWLSGELRTYPSHLAQEIEYIVPTPPKSLLKDSLKGVAELKEQLELRIHTIKKLLSRQSWDGAFIVFSEPDFLFHGLFDKIIYGRNEKLLDSIYDIFSEIDRVIGFIAGKNEDGVNAVVSDHGFTICNKSLDMTSTLSRLKVINFKKAGIEERLDAFSKQAYHKGIIRAVKIPSLLYEIVSNVKKKSLFSQLFSISMTMLKRTLGFLPIAEYGKCVDYCNSFVIPYAPNGVALLLYMNTKGKFLCGRLDDQNTMKIQKFLVYFLRNLRDRKGNRLFQLVDTPENIYQGPYVNQAPSVIAIPNLDVGYYVSLSHNSSQTIFTHDLKGVAMFHGDNIKKGYYFGTISVYDIVPTLLYLTGLPLPEFSDGKILYKIIDSKYIKILIKDYLSKYKLALTMRKFRSRHNTQM